MKMRSCLQLAAVVLIVTTCANVAPAQFASDLPSGSSAANWSIAKIDTPARSQSYLNRRVSLTLKNTPFVSALHKIAAITNVDFSYGNRTLSAANKITADLNGLTLEQALNRVFVGTDLTWVPMKGEHIVIRQEKNGAGGSGSITGKVVDATTGEPLPGATVFLEGSSMGASADLNGNYIIPDVPSGSYKVRVSYVGYRTSETTVNVENGEQLKENLRLQPVGVKGKEVVVTAQVSGQNSAINQQLSSNNIVSVVSAAKITALPDANAAESVGRLPGVSVTRSGGEATGVVIRGLQPKYNEIMIDGVQMAATSTGDRSTDLSMISSNSLSGIEVYKTVTPDMDAAVLGGVVNFQVREAHKTPTGAPRVMLWAQGGYTNLVNSYDNYKFVGSVENRYLDDRFGIFAQAIVERINLTDDEMGGSFSVENGQRLTGQHIVYMNSLNLAFVPRERQRYDGTLVLDYRLPQGKIDLMNFFSQGNTTTNTLSQNYNLDANSITFGDAHSLNTLNTVTNLLDYKQTFGTVRLHAKLSNSFSENNTPSSWNVNFVQAGAGVANLPKDISPVQFVRDAASEIQLQNMFWWMLTTSNSYSKQQNITGSLDLERTFNLSSLVTATLKAGADYMYTYRWYSYGDLTGPMDGVDNQTSRVAVLQAFPWLTQPPYNLSPNGGEQISILPFVGSGFSYGNFLNGEYQMGPATDFSMIETAMQAVIDTNAHRDWVLGRMRPGNLDIIENNYHGYEHRKAAYIMATIDLGQHLTVIPGVRYQGLGTSYYAPRIYDATFPYTYPVVYPHQDTTINEYHGYWLPDISLIYRPVSWLNVKLAYTNTLSYPDFTQLTPLIVMGVSSITWHNYALSPARSYNYDAAFSIFNNTIGLLTASAFLKQIDGLIFSTGARYPENFLDFPGVANLVPYVQYSINYSINDPYRVNVWGVGGEWQTHFWYLPYPLDGLVLSLNYTHLFSAAKYPFTYNYQSGYPPKVTYVDTFYTDRLYQQPNDIANISIGYDFKGFSVLVSMIYQSNVFNSNNFWPELRGYKTKYERWDLSARQKLPWQGVEVYLDINDLNNESDVYVVAGPGFPSSEQDYGRTADLGLRWTF